MDLTKEQKEIYSKIADIKQVILKNHFDISDLTEQLISTLPFKVDDIVLNQSNEHLLVRKIEPYDHGFGLNEHRYLGKNRSYSQCIKQRWTAIRKKLVGFDKRREY